MPSLRSITAVAGLAAAVAAVDLQTALAFAGGALAAGLVLAGRRQPPDSAALLAKQGDELRALLASNRDLMAALARRDQHLAHTAHELRTPLTSVLTALEMVRDGYATTPAEQAEFLDEADLAARHLTYLVNDVLDSAALAAGALQLDCGRHRVSSLLRDGLRILGLQAQRRGIAVDCEPVPDDIGVHTDGRRFLQVLFNLLGNALKFSTAGQPIRIAVEPRPERVRVRIIDQGPGVPPELRDRLFTPFGRGGDASGQPSTGLGLHITRQLVHQMGGTIGYLPGHPRGSEFWFEMPAVAFPSEAEPPTLSTTSAGAANQSVVAIDQPLTQ
jgi:signal transduction histidine kinase